MTYQRQADASVSRSRPMGSTLHVFARDGGSITDQRNGTAQQRAVARTRLEVHATDQTTELRDHALDQDPASSAGNRSSQFDVTVPLLRPKLPLSTGEAARQFVQRQAVTASAALRDHGDVGFSVLVVLVAAAVVHAVGMFDTPMRVDDEGTYVAQAWAVQHWGELAHYTYWYDHPPFGWIQIAAWTWLTDAFDRAPNAVAAGREFMLVLKVVSCALLWTLARRLRLRPAGALAAVALFAFSPLAIAFTRMVFLDNVSIPWLLAAFALALAPRRGLAAASASGLCFAVAVLSKETTLLLAPALLWQLWTHYHVSTRRMAAAVNIGVMAMVGVMYPLFALLKGELLPGPGHVSLLSAVYWQLFERAGSGMVLDPASAARGVVETWLQLDPLLLVAATAAIPVGLAVSRLRPITLAYVIQLALLVGRDGYLPYPYVIGMLPFAALIVAGAADTLIRFPVSSVLRNRWIQLGRWAVAGVATVVASAALAIALPAWHGRLSTQMHADEDAGMRQAAAWVEANVPRDQHVIVDDALWVDLVDAGFNPRLGVVWFYKLDLDPAIKLPRGWRGVDYAVLVGPPAQYHYLPKVKKVLQHSSTVARFGEGQNTVTVYKQTG